jgi:uncharacterized protein (DUF1778 family)
MADTLTIRLDDRDREILEAAAQRSGTGLSGFIRALAEAEARRLRNASIRAEGERVVAYLEAHPEARGELEMWSDIGISAWPVSEWPVGEFQ